MKVNKGFKFRLYPTKEQESKLQHCFLSITKPITSA
ncbi:helix-turn-helix domain-containing protein [Helicobacter pylori]|nr:helix-turn-helix domain-containing protein [Helicobacter pylori]WRA99291.1 helix-turn-helix domain-containing protein [Helicobacter pylori]